jgi:anti-anti-sigma factor
MLTIDTEKMGDVAVVRCSGRLVRGEAVRTLRNAMVNENGTRIVMLDLTEVETMDAGGLTALLSLHRWTRSHAIQLKLVNPSHFVREILERTQLDRIFDFSSLQDALQVLGAKNCRPPRCLDQVWLTA